MAVSPTLHPFLTAPEIDRLITQLAARISEDYAPRLSDTGALHIIVTLKGALFFAADLIRKLTVPCRVDFVRLSSYGAGTKSSGNVRILKDIETPLAGEHVLIVDEIVDSGRTVDFLVNRLKASRPASVRVCGLLSKPSRREIPVEVHYLGREVEDKFLVGYGLDYGEKYRNLGDICYLES